MSNPNSEKDKKPKTPLYQEVDGCKLPIFFSPDAFKSALAYKPRADDLFIVSYPKCGTNWIHYIMACILREGKIFNSILDYLTDDPFLHMTGAEGVEKMKRPGAIKLHLPFHMMPWSPDAKYIFIARNPKDCCVSFYHHTVNSLGYHFEDGTFDDFFEVFIKGEADYGDYFDFTLSWYEHRNDPNVLFMTFEDLKKDTVNNILKIAGFIGPEYREKLEKDDKMLQDIIRRTSLDFAKEHMYRMQIDGKKLTMESIMNHPKLTDGLKFMLFSGESATKIEEDKSTNLIRKGAVGDWRNYFSLVQNNRLEQKIRQKFAGTDLLELWRDYM